MHLLTGPLRIYGFCFAAEFLCRFFPCCFQQVALLFPPVEVLGKRVSQWGFFWTLLLNVLVKLHPKMSDGSKKDWLLMKGMSLFKSGLVVCVCSFK